MVVNVGIIKVGNIGISTLIDLILDERADREDIIVKTIGSGSKMRKSEVTDVLNRLHTINTDILIFVSPNPNAKQIKEALIEIAKLDIPTVVIGDKPGEKAIPFLEENNFGYILIRGDPMIGARRELLDPTEMALFNSYVMNVLANTGVIRLTQTLIDNLIKRIKDEEEIILPKTIVTAQEAMKYAVFRNDYAKAKAIAAYQISSQVYELDAMACFTTNNKREYLPLVTAAHEMMKIASRLSEEAREIEKSNDTVKRTPHRKDGFVLNKRKLMDNWD